LPTRGTVPLTTETSSGRAAETTARPSTPPGGKLKALRPLLWWTPAAFAAAYLITLATQSGQLLANTYLNADAASAPVIGELLGQASGHPQVVLGHLGWFSTLLFELGTRWLPLHRQLWEAAPYAMALGSAALVGWGAWRVAGRWAGMIATTLMVCAGPSALSLLLVLNDHAPTWFTLALLGALLVALVHSADRLAVGWLAALALAVGVILGVNGASDILLTIAGAIPFLLAAVATWALRPSRTTATALALALATGLVALASGLIAHDAVRHWHIISAADQNTQTLAASGAFGTNFKLWWQSIALLGNGNFFGEEIGFSAALALACGILSVVAVGLAARTAKGELTAALRARGRQSSRAGEGSGADVSVGSGAGGGADGGGRADRDPAADARLAWCLFWGSSLVALSAAFLFSGLPEDLGSSRYLLGLIYAAAALVPLLARSGWPARVAVTAGVTLYAFTGWLALAQQRIGPPTSPSDRLAGAVADIAKKEHLSVGYAGYWDAAPITWATHFRVKVYPVDDCDGNLHLCGFELHFISSWYTPAPAMRTFLLSDSAYPAEPSAPTPDLGRPIAVHPLGTVTMYVYSYNIASRLYAL
jgi:hypothetical protein